MNLIGKIDFVDSVSDFGTSPELNGATDVVTALVNGVRFVYVAGTSDGGIQILRLANDGTLTPAGSVAMPGVFGLEVVVVGSERFLAASAPSSIRMFRIDDDGVGSDGQLVSLETYEDAPSAGGATEGQGVLSNIGDLVQVGVGNARFVVASGYNSDSLAVFRVGQNGLLTRTDAETDDTDPNFRLDAAFGVAAHAVGQNTYVFVGSDSENAVSSYRLTAAGQLNFVGSAAGALQASEMVAANYNGTDYLFVSDTSQQLLMVYRIGQNGGLTFVSQTPQYINGDYNGITGLTVVEVSGVPFLAAAAPSQDTVLLLSLDDNEVLRIVQVFRDVTEVNGAVKIIAQQMGDREFLLVGARDGDRVTVLEIGAQDDPILGTETDDRMVGHLADDDLIGLAGADEMFGGAGFDVLSGRDGNDSLFGGADNDVLVGGDGNDLLAGGQGADVIVGGEGRDLLSYVFSGAGVTVGLPTGLVRGGDAEGDRISEIENVEGSNHADSLTGDLYSNLIRGLDGADVIDGKSGRDRLDGGARADTILGGNGNDKIYGGQGSDSLDGQNGDDQVFGGTGNDRLFGAAGNDTLTGNDGNDRLNAGSGDNVLFGGAGEDVFVFAPGLGDDVVEDFDVLLDRIDLTALPGFDSLAEVQAAAFTIAGNTFLSIDGGASSITLLGVVEAQLTDDNVLY